MDDTLTESSDDGVAAGWYAAHKRDALANGREPLSWGAWLAAGMPSPAE